MSDHVTVSEVSEPVGCRESRVKVLGPDVIEIYIAPVGSRYDHGLGQLVRRLVVDDMINTDGLDIPAFFGATCRSDDCVPLDLCDLTHDLAHGAGRSRDK